MGERNLDPQVVGIQSAPGNAGEGNVIGPPSILRIGIDSFEQRSRVERFGGGGRTNDQELAVYIVIALSSGLGENALCKSLRGSSSCIHAVLIHFALQNPSVKKKQKIEKKNSLQTAFGFSEGRCPSGGTCSVGGSSLFKRKNKTGHAEQERQDQGHGDNHLHMRFCFGRSKIEAVGCGRKEKNSGKKEERLCLLSAEDSNKDDTNRNEYGNVTKRKPGVPFQSVREIGSVYEVIQNRLIAVAEGIGEARKDVERRNLRKALVITRRCAGHPQAELQKKNIENSAECDRTEGMDEKAQAFPGARGKESRLWRFGIDFRCDGIQEHKEHQKCGGSDSCLIGAHHKGNAEGGKENPQDGRGCHRCQKNPHCEYSQKERNREGDCHVAEGHLTDDADRAKEQKAGKKVSSGRNEIQKLQNQKK